MCGVVGIFDTTGRRAVDEALLRRMNESQHHRGPDEGGYHIEPGVGLGHRRLSIIDLSSGQQPLFNEDGTVVVSYNGEIYNFPLLTVELSALGHRFRTHSDTEVIVHAWEEWGEACVERFRGMFAFALWDRSQETLFLARDRVGIKPMHYALLPDGRLAFGSELKSIMCLPSVRRDLDVRAIEEYFALGYVPDPRTIYESVHKLPPGSTLSVRRGERIGQPRIYWDVPFRLNGVRRAEEACEDLVSRLEEAVRIRMVAEVPLGAFLSGGVDSSAVVAMMARSSNGPVNTCSISFPVPEYDEVEFANQVAARYGTAHQVREVNPDDLELVDRLTDFYDEPFADSSAMPTYRVCELARERVTVALSGDGGDESFAGYRRYRWHAYEERLRSLMPLGVRRPLFGALGALYPKLDWAPRYLRGKSTFQALARTSVEGYYANFCLLPDALRRSIYSPELIRRLSGYRAIEVFAGHLENAPEDPISRVQYLDFKTYLAGDILTKVDRASMAHSLEVRVPILDHEFVEWVSGLPSSIKLRGSEGKHVFKRALEPYLPQDVLYRPKMGFAVPLASWFRGPLREHVRAKLLGPAIAGSGLFDVGTVSGIVDSHQSGRRDFSAAIWSLLMFESFQRRAEAGTAG